jgi:arsenical pump membrane protein
VLARPRYVNEAAAAVLGAVLVLAAGWARPDDVLRGIQDTAGVLLFLLAMMLLAHLAETAGVFHWAAGWALRTACGRGWVLFVNLYLLGALITLLLSLDVTAVMLTPVVCALVRRLRLDPVPYVLACAFVANTASLALPVSNLTNILVYDLLGVGFWDFVRYLALPNLVALAINVSLLVLLFWHKLPGTIVIHVVDRAAPLSPFFRWSLATLATTVALLIVAGMRGWSFWPVALPPALFLAALALRRRWISPAMLRQAIAWPLPPFVIGMYVIVMAVYRALEAPALNLPAVAAHLPGPLPLLATALSTAIGANMVNNLPLTLAAIQVLRAVDPALATAAGVNLRTTLAMGMLLGVNLGPTLTVTGSLATMLCLAIARRHGITIPARAVLRAGAISALPMLLAATLTLSLLLR